MDENLRVAVRGELTSKTSETSFSRMVETEGSLPEDATSPRIIVAQLSFSRLIVHVHKRSIYVYKNKCIQK